MLRQWAAVPIGTSNLDEPSLAGLGARGVTPHSLPPTVYHLKPLSAAHNMVQGHTAAATLVHHCCLHCRETHLLQLGHLDKGLCGAAEQELTTHQRHCAAHAPSSLLPLGSLSPRTQWSWAKAIQHGYESPRVAQRQHLSHWAAQLHTRWASTWLLDWRLTKPPRDRQWSGSWEPSPARPHQGLMLRLLLTQPGHSPSSHAGVPGLHICTQPSTLCTFPPFPWDQEHWGTAGNGWEQDRQQSAWGMST